MHVEAQGLKPVAYDSSKAEQYVPSLYDRFIFMLLMYLSDVSHLLAS